MAAFNGQGGNVTIGVATYHVKEWSFEDGADAINVTNTGSAGFKEKIAAPRGASGSFTIVLDASTLVTIPSGTTGTATFTLGTSGKAMSLTEIVVTKATYKNPAEEDVELEVSFESSGVYSGPA